MTSELKDRVEKLQGESLWRYDLRRDYNAILKELQEREEKLIRSLRFIRHEYERLCDADIIAKMMYERARDTLKELGIE